jgi:hypothetical protein
MNLFYPVNNFKIEHFYHVNNFKDETLHPVNNFKLELLFGKQFLKLAENRRQWLELSRLKIQIESTKEHQLNANKRTNSRIGRQPTC